MRQFRLSRTCAALEIPPVRPLWPVLAATTIIDKMSRRAILILVLLLGIAAFSVALLLRGEGSYLVGVVIAIGFLLLFGLALMMRWTFSLLLWGGISNWLRNRRR